MPSSAHWKDPRRFARLARKSLLQLISPALKRSAFYLQGQMDIHPSSKWYKPDFVAETGGFLPRTATEHRVLSDLEPWDSVRRDMLTLLLRSIVEREIPGDFLELGVYKGWTARLIHRYAPERQLHLFDTFAGFDGQDVAAELRTTGLEVSGRAFADTSEEAVRALIGSVNGNVHTYAGFFPRTLPPELLQRSFAFVHLDADLYEPILAGLTLLYPRVSAGGFIVVHDYNAWPGSRAAVDTFFADKPEVPIPMPDKSGSVVIAKS